MGSATIDTMKKVDENAARGVETFSMLPECIRIVTDGKDPLWDPDCEKSFDQAMMDSFMSGVAMNDPIDITNRGKKGGEPDYVVVDGRNRLKCAIERNRLRVEDGKEPLRITVKQCRPEDAVSVKIASGTKAKRSPLYWPKMWHHFRGMESPNGSEAEERDARKRFMKMAGVTQGAVGKWDKLLSAHPEVLQMVEAKLLRPADVHDIVDAVAWNDQPEAARKIAARKSAPDSDRAPEPVASQHAETIPAPAPEPVAEPAPKQTKKQHRARVLGLDTTKAKSLAEIRDLSAALTRSGKEEFAFAVAVLDWAANKDGALDDFAHLVNAAKAAGWNGK